MGLMDIFKKKIEPYEEPKVEKNQQYEGIKKVWGMPEANNAEGYKIYPRNNPVDKSDSKLIDNRIDTTQQTLNEDTTLKKEPYGYSRPFYREKKNIIIFVLENTAKVSEHKNEILGIVKKIVQDNNSSLFMFLRVGNNKKFYDVLDSQTIDKENIIEQFLLFDNENEEKVNLTEALNHINTFYNSILQKLGIFEHKEKKYDIQEISAIFVGTAAHKADESIEEIAKLITSIKIGNRTKTIKYFCMEDKETINAAMLGFPVVGHIVSDFYK